MAETAGSRRPADSAFKQQRLKAWQPILTPKWVISSFMAIGVAFIGIGIAVLGASNQVLSRSVKYSDTCQDKIAAWDAKTTQNCIIPFSTGSEDGWGTQDFFAYYQLDNFYQNHRKYVQSRAPQQLAGNTLDGLLDDSAKDPPQIEKDGSLGDCTSSGYSVFVDPSDKNEVYMYPCGLVAMSLFNDTLKLREKETGKYVMWNQANTACGLKSEPCPTNPEGVAWKSDVDMKYNSPSVKWIKKNCKYIGGADLASSGWIHPDLGTLDLRPAENCGAPMCGMRVYDGNVGNKGIYNCWHNVSNEDFIVWMRVAALPSFKKLYRKIPKELLKKSTTYELVVSNRFPVASFKGSKSFVLSTTSWIGGKNMFLGYAYIIVGAICIALALAFLGKELVSPRKLGDPQYLSFK